MARSAAQRQEEPDPAGPDPVAALTAAAAECEAALRRLRPGADDRAMTELYELQMRLSAARIAFESWTMERFCRDELIALGRKLERQEQAAAVPERGARHALKQSMLERRMRLVTGIVVGAGTAAASVLQRAWAAHPVATAAAGAVPVALASVVTLAPGSVHTLQNAISSGGSPSASATATAVPIPAASFIAASGPSAGHGKAAVKGKGIQILGVPGFTPVPCCSGTYSPSSLPAAPQPPAQQAPPAPGTLVIAGALDLGTAGSAALTVTAFVNTVTWTASSSLPGLTLDGQTSETGTLAQHEQQTITVAIDAADLAAGGNGTITFTMDDGQQRTVSVTWEAPPVVPSPADTTVPDPAAS